VAEKAVLAKFLHPQGNEHGQRVSHGGLFRHRRRHMHAMAGLQQGVMDGRESRGLDAVVIGQQNPHTSSLGEKIRSPGGATTTRRIDKKAQTR